MESVLISSYSYQSPYCKQIIYLLYSPRLILAGNRRLTSRTWKTFVSIIAAPNTAWKGSAFGVFLVRIFPQSDWIRRGHFSGNHNKAVSIKPVHTSVPLHYKTFQYSAFVAACSLQSYPLLHLNFFVLCKLNSS